MDRFIAQANIRHFRDRLWSETDFVTRSRLQQLLLAEEDKLAKDFELLADIERHISDGRRRIEKQRSLVAAMKRDGHSSLRTAQALLNGMADAQQLHMKYRETILIAIDQNRL